MSVGDVRSDQDHLLRPTPSSALDSDLESQAPKTRRIRDLFKQFDRGFSGRRSSRRFLDRETDSPLDHSFHDSLGDGAPPEWALLLLGCFLGLATGLCVAVFNHGVADSLPPFPS